MAKVTLNKPTKGTKDWHTPANENFTDTERNMNVHDRLSGPFFAHEQSVPDMSVAVDAGFTWDGTTLADVAAQNTSNFAAPSTNDRIDRIVLDDNTGTLSVLTGSENVSPSPPALSAGQIPCAQVYLTPTTAEITDADITDERAVLPKAREAVLFGIEADENNNLYNYGTKIVSETAAFTLGAGHNGRTVEVSDTADVNVTVPSDATDNRPVGYATTLVQVNTGQIVLVADTGVTIRTPETLKSHEQWSVIGLYKRGADEWVVFGDIEPVG